MSQAQTLNPVASRPGRKVSYEEFLNGDWGTNHIEWVNGEIIMMAAVSDEHTHVTGFLLSVLRVFVEMRKLGVIMHEPFQMKTGPDLPGRAPDLFFVANVNLPRLKKLYLEGPADLVIEVISFGSERVDRSDKFSEYEQGGVKEYWLIDPLRKQADFYSRTAEGRFQSMSTENGSFHSRVLEGLWLKIDWLWNRPGVIQVLKEWGLV